MQNFWSKLPRPILALAPMAGVNDSAFRQMCKIFGADVIYTEFASANALVYDNKKTREMLSFAATEQPVVCQIFGRDPAIFAKTVKILEAMGFAGIDINFGCPAYKVVKTGGGVSLMRNLNLCRELVQAASENTSLPISIKIRASIKHNQSTKDKIDDLSEASLAQADTCLSNSDTVTALDLVNKIKDLRIGAIMIHARTFEQPFDGEPNLDVIKQVRKVWPGILLANGGIYTPEKAKEILQDTGADGVGIARGAWGKPWLFQQIKQYLSTAKYDEMTWERTKELMLQHAAICLTTKGEYGLIELRKHLSWYIKGRPHAAQVRAQLVRIKTLDDIKSILN